MFPNTDIQVLGVDLTQEMLGLGVEARWLRRDRQVSWLDLEHFLRVTYARSVGEVIILHSGNPKRHETYRFLPRGHCV